MSTNNIKILNKISDESILKIKSLILSKNQEFLKPQLDGEYSPFCFDIIMMFNSKECIKHRSYGKVYSSNIPIINSFLKIKIDKYELNSTEFVNKLQEHLNKKIIITKVDCLDVSYIMYDHNYSIKPSFSETEINNNLTLRNINLNSLLNNFNEIELNNSTDDIRIYIFPNVIWLNLLFCFMKYGYYLNGGIPSKRHILSKNQSILSIFIQCIDKNLIDNLDINEEQYISDKFEINFTVDSTIFNEIEKYNISRKFKVILMDALYSCYMYERIFKLTHHYMLYNGITTKTESEIKSMIIDSRKYDIWKYNENKYYIIPNFINEQNLNLHSKEYKNVSVTKYNYFKKSMELKKHLNNKINILIPIADEIIKQNIKTIGKNSSLLKKLTEFYVKADHKFNTINFNNNYYLSNINKRQYSTLALNNVKINNNQIISHMNDLPVLNNDIINTIINSELYIYIKSILNDNSININEKQFKIEKYLNEDFKKEYLKLLLKPNKFFESKYGIDIIISAIANLEKSLDDYKNNKKFHNNKKYKIIFEYMSNQELITITLYRVIPFIMKSTENQNVTQLFYEVGKDILSLMVQKEKMKTNNNLMTFYNDDEIKFKIGADIVEYIGLKSEFYSIMTELINGKSRRIIVSDHLLDLIYKKHVTMTTNNLPMICAPLNWKIKIHKDNKYVIEKYGGYFTSESEKSGFIHESNKNGGKTLFKNDDIVNTINYLQSIPLSVNNKVLNYLIKCINENIDFRDQFILEKHPNSNELFKLKMNLPVNEAKILEILVHNSKYYDNIGTLHNALLLKDVVFYLPYFCDWRGRLYTTSKYLSFQGNEFSKSLILFKEGHSLNDSGLKALKIYIAGCFGYNKMSFKNRIQWVEDNLNNIIDIESNFWLTAKSPFLALSSSIELKDYLDNPIDFKSRLPIFIDATCNGLQHLSAMMNDLSLGKHVNILKSTDKDIPQDIYSSMVKKVNNEIDILIKNDMKYMKLKELKIDRSFIKRGIMTIPYGVKVRGITDQLIADHFKLSQVRKGTRKLYNIINEELCDVRIFFEYNHIVQFAKIIHLVLFKSYPQLTQLVDYLVEINKFIYSLNLNLPTVWLAPSGLIIEQKYVQMNENVIKYSILGQRKTITLNKKTDKVNIRKQNQGIIPNIVHSMDASNISLLIKTLLNLKNKFPILTIHDCFGSHGNNIDILSHIVKIAFLNIYGDQNFIDNYHNFILDYLSKLGIDITEDNKAVIFNSKIIKIPLKPTFSKDENFKDNLLSSMYFLH